MISDQSKQSSICPKHGLEQKSLHQNQFSQKQVVCGQCIDEFHHDIPIEQLIESNQELIQSIESQAKSNSITMNLLINSLIQLREEISKTIEILINEIRKQIKINEDDALNIKDNVLNKQEIRSFYNKSIEGQRLFQKNAIQQIESLKSNPVIDSMIETINKLNLEFFNDEVQKKKISIQEIKQSNVNQIKINQTQDIKRHEYQLYEQSSMMQSNICWAIAFNKDASIVVAGDDYDIKVFEFKNEKLKEIQLLKSHSDTITCLQFMKKSNQFISGSSDNTIKIRQQYNNSEWIYVDTLVGHNDFGYSLVINYNEDLIISGGLDKLIIFQRLSNQQWSKDQTIQCVHQLWSLSLNNINTKLVSSGTSKLIYVFEQYGNKWEIAQIINTELFGLRICFISDDDFVFLPNCSECLHFYNFNQISKQFQKVDELQIKNDNADTDGFPIQFIDSKKLLIVKKGKFVNILRKQENGKFIFNQSIEFDDYNTFGSVSDNGQLLITWNYQSRKIELRILVQILRLYFRFKISLISYFIRQIFFKLY